MATYKLWYFIEGKDVLSCVTISKDRVVDELREEIYGKFSGGYWNGVEAIELVLIKVDMYPDIHELRAPDGAPIMHPLQQIQQLWPNKPTEGCLHVCVRLPSESPQDWQDEAAEEYLKGPLATSEPFALAKSKAVRDMQTQPGKRLANDRPHPDADHLPIALLYHGFGRFLDFVTGTSLDLMLEIDQQEFERNVDDFMMSMNAYHTKEKNRQSQALHCLNTIFRCCLRDHTQDLVTGTVGGALHFNGRVLGPASTIEAVLIVKNELGSSGVDPTIELAAYYTQSLKDDSAKALLSHFFFPALGIVVIGSHIGFYALAFKGKTRLVALTPLLPMVTESGNNWVKPALLKAFRAACILRHHIHEDTKKFSRSLSIHRNLPYINKVTAYPPSVAGTSASAIHFCLQTEIYCRKPQYPNQFLYLATQVGTVDKVIVKFTQQYCPGLHLFCAKRHHAPQLLGYDTIPGGWHVVVMGWINQEDTNLQLYAHDHLPTWSKDLKSLVRDFHENGWVHGDLRDTNMIISDKEPEQVMLVNFDWGGKVTSTGPVYPTALVDDELTKHEHPGDIHITKEHDDNVLALTLDKLARQTTSL